MMKWGQIGCLAESIDKGAKRRQLRQFDRETNLDIDSCSNGWLAPRFSP